MDIIWKYLPAFPISFNGREGTLEFTASELNSDSGAVIAIKITNTFFELVEVDGEDWKIIRRQWTAEGNKEVKFANPMTPDEAIAEHVVDGLATVITPTTEREKLDIDPGVAWYDEDNKLSYDNAGGEETILWVQDSLLTDELEDAGKKVQYKGQLVKNMISNGDVYGKGVRKKLPSLVHRKKLYPFKPEALGVSWEDVSFQAPADADNDETDMEITP